MKTAPISGTYSDCLLPENNFSPKVWQFISSQHEGETLPMNIYEEMNNYLQRVNITDYTHHHHLLPGNSGKFPNHAPEHAMKLTDFNPNRICTSFHRSWGNVISIIGILVLLIPSHLWIGSDKKKGNLILHLKRNRLNCFTFYHYVEIDAPR